MYIDGTANTGVCVVAPTQTYAFGTGDFTVEFWLNRNAVGVKHELIKFGASGACLGIYATATNGNVNVGGVTNIVVGTAACVGLANTGYHVAVVRLSGITYVYVNGVLYSSGADANNYTVAAGYPMLSGAATANLNGYLSDVRITSGVARYNGNFTVPLMALPLV